VVAAVLLAAAVNMPASAPVAEAAGFTNTVQLAPLPIVDEPLEQVPPLSMTKFVEFDSDRPTTEDV
jgi:hypothetical protein